jgi:hypothetical protein
MAMYSAWHANLGKAGQAPNSWHHADTTDFDFVGFAPDGSAVFAHYLGSTIFVHPPVDGLPAFVTHSPDARF